MVKDQIIKKIKQWFWILTGIWVAFWVLDVLVLVPLYPEGGIAYNIKAIFADEFDLALVYLIITAPVYLYLVSVLIKKIAKAVLVFLGTRRRPSF
ncbi:MAG: hypothetical protein UV76_C0018G0002 [Candidatus Nomurabacteria bacterium GW2011_GWA2_43_15]|uniref:Uncharacterized protein n=1 Tax=Candidatus Nomurabacteria bacterium GW2011_GWA2_43_15 TaxID=1618738 RepID=A0A0G1DPM2_9BACT|nr:MAG: hypothetical protein UV76_C0018G0002 [Candidatus Nomurabacteria bacterium GW2011_GWA2_43_15]